MPLSKTDKQCIAESFSRSARQYDLAANVQHQAGKALLAVLSQYLTHSQRQQVATVADIGCGTGYFSGQLVQQYQPQQFMGIDIAEGMLAVAAEYFPQLDNTVWLCGDAECLSLSDNSLDIIFANFSLQWCEDLPRLFQEFYRVLRPGGVCCFNTLGPKTLSELRSAWSAVDPLNHVNQFESSVVWQQAMESQPLQVLHHQVVLMAEYFSSAREALQSLKRIGANIVRGEYRQSLTGKQRFSGFVEAYEVYRQTDGLPMTYEVDQWLVQKVSACQNPNTVNRLPM